jgi:hypothetical protein
MGAGNTGIDFPAVQAAVLRTKPFVFGEPYPSHWGSPFQTINIGRGFPIAGVLVRKERAPAWWPVHGPTSLPCRMPTSPSRSSEEKVRE